MIEPFVNTCATGSSRTSGLGLGLAVVRALVDAQHGQVGIDSGPTGSTVTITIPRATPWDAAITRPARTPPAR